MYVESAAAEHDERDEAADVVEAIGHADGELDAAVGLHPWSQRDHHFDDHGAVAVARHSRSLRHRRNRLPIIAIDMVNGRGRFDIPARGWRLTSRTVGPQDNGQGDIVTRIVGDVAADRRRTTSAGRFRRHGRRTRARTRIA